MRPPHVDYLTSQFREKASSSWKTDLLPTPASWDASTKTILLFASSCLCLTSPVGVDGAEYSHRQWLQQPVQVALLDLEGNVLFWKAATFLLLGPYFRSGVILCREDFMNFQFCSAYPFSGLRILCWPSWFFCCYFPTLYSTAQKVAECLLSQ